MLGERPGLPLLVKLESIKIGKENILTDAQSQGAIDLLDRMFLHGLSALMPKLRKIQACSGEKRRGVGHTSASLRLISILPSRHKLGVAAKRNLTISEETCFVDSCPLPAGKLWTFEGSPGCGDYDVNGAQHGTLTRAIPNEGR